ncbi:hypothetical protein MASR2M41_08650 [Flammeovirgaceae bacterium]
MQGLLAQSQLALFKNDQVITRYKEGEYIRFQKKDSNAFTRAIITGIYPGYFMLGKDTIHHYEVAKIDVRSKSVSSFNTASAGKALIVAGASLIAIDAFNTLVVQDRPYKIERGVRTASFTLIGVGGLMQVFNNKYFKIGPKRKVATLNY